MGAWDSGSFDNDTACDWAYEISTVSDLNFIERTIDAVFPLSYIDSDIGSEVVAAADVLARLNGKFLTKNAYTEDVDSWVAKHQLTPSGKLKQKALDALNLVQSKKSELAELWEGDDDWIKNIERLKESIQ